LRAKEQSDALVVARQMNDDFSPDNFPEQGEHLGGSEAP